MIRKAACGTFLCVGFLLASGPPDAMAQASAPKLLGEFDKWASYAYESKSGRVCHAISQPEDKEPKNVNRDPVYFFVSHRPKEGVRNEVSVITGYPYKPGSTTSGAIGPDKYSMFTKGDGAWIDGKETEAKVVDSMKRGSSMIVKGTSRRGTLTTDKYSLAGVTKALDRIAAECK